MIRSQPIGSWVAAAVLLAALGAAPAFADTKAFQFVLQNGLQVVVVPDHRTPIVSELVVYKAGAVDDPPGLSGLAHVTEEMMFRGTKALPGSGFVQTMTHNSGDADGFATHDYTVFRDQAPRDRLRLILHLEADRMAGLDLTDSSVGAERDAALDERRLHVDGDPQAQLLEQGEAALQLSHPYGRPVIGWPDEIRHIGRVETEDFFRHHYAPNNAILIVAGDTTPDEVRADAEAEFAPVSSHELAVRADWAQPPRLGETRLSIARKGAKAARFLRLYRVQSYAEAAPGQAEALEVLARILGGGQSSLLYRKLVTERHLASAVDATYDGYARDAGEFRIAATPGPGVAQDALERAVDETVVQILHRAPTKAELVHAKAQLVSGATFRHDAPSDIASAYARALAIGLTAYDVQQWPQRIAAVSAADVRKAAAASLVPAESVTAYLTPEPK